MNISEHTVKTCKYTFSKDEIKTILTNHVHKDVGRSPGSLFRWVKTVVEESSDGGFILEASYEYYHTKEAI